MKHIKTLGLLAVAVMALAAFFGTASASAATFTAGASGKKINETTLANHVFSVTGNKTECTNITYTGSTEGTDTSAQMVTPKYEGCTAFGFAATVTVTNCTYNLLASGEVKVEKAGGAEACSITIKVNNVFAQCEVTIGAQNIASAVTYSNGSGDIVVKVNASTIKDEVKVSSGLCPLTKGTHSNASYTGESTVQAEGTTLAFDA